MNSYTAAYYLLLLFLFSYFYLKYSVCTHMCVSVCVHACAWAAWVVRGRTVYYGNEE